MLVKIHVHSTLSHLFSESIISADLKYYLEVIRYFSTMQPKFINYLRQQDSIGVEESYALLDSNLTLITPDDLLIKRFNEGDTIYVVPAIMGGGGKRGGLLAVAALASVFVLAPALAPALAQAGVPGAGAFATTLADKGLFAAIKGSSFLSSVLTNVGLALLSSLFMKKPEKADSNSRNDMFGALKNTIESGTPIPIHYGLVRVGGQFISGYIQTIDHAKGENISVNSLVSRSSTFELSESSYTTGLTDSLLTTTGNISDSWVQKTLDLSEYAGALVRVVFKHITYGEQAGIGIDSIVIDSNTYNFDSTALDFEVDSNYSGTVEYADVNWETVGSRLHSFYIQEGEAQSGNFYLSSLTSPFITTGKTRWLRSPTVLLGETPVLTFYENRKYSDKPVNVYLDIVW